MLASLQKTIIYNYFSKIFTRGSEKVHFRIALCSIYTYHNKTYKTTENSMVV